MNIGSIESGGGIRIKKKKIVVDLLLPGLFSSEKVDFWSTYSPKFFLSNDVKILENFTSLADLSRIWWQPYENYLNSDQSSQFC
jgi:hypothetical protein